MGRLDLQLDRKAFISAMNRLKVFPRRTLDWAQLKYKNGMLVAKIEGAVVNVAGKGTWSGTVSVSTASLLKLRQSLPKRKEIRLWYENGFLCTENKSVLAHLEKSDPEPSPAPPTDLDAPAHPPSSEPAVEEAKPDGNGEDFLGILEWTLEALSYENLGDARDYLSEMNKMARKAKTLGMPDHVRQEALKAVETAQEALSLKLRDVRKAIWTLWKLHHKLRIQESLSRVKSSRGVLVVPGAPYHVGSAACPTKLRFGGLEVEYCTGNKFRLTYPYDPSCEVTIDEADVTDTLKFMLLHFKPCMGNSIQPA